MKKTTKHLPRTWERITNTSILDPDGWRDGTSWNKPIDFKEWTSRMNQSTIAFAHRMKPGTVKFN
jgi:hypothetical protein